jgi:DeoR family transcriptional regulator, aga operon transcriptional repressor
MAPVRDAPNRPLAKRLPRGKGATSLRPQLPNGSDQGASPPSAGTSLFRIDRLRAILEVINESSQMIGVNELAKRLAVSVPTARRDLAHLAAQGLLVRSYGGATKLTSDLEVPVYYRASSFAAEKRRIGSRAAQMAEDGSVVGLTGGTTTMEVARALASRQRLTVVTNALNIGYELARRSNIRLVLTGGVCRPASFELSGSIAESTLEEYHLDLAYVGVDGIEVAAGCTTHDDVEARANNALVKRAQRVIVVADRSKIGRIAFARICHLAAVEVLVTDDGADTDATTRLERAGLRVVRA